MHDIFYEFSGTVDEFVSMSCGCKIAGRHILDTGFEFHYLEQCPKHAAAPVMYEVLKEVYGEVWFYDTDIKVATVDKIKNALALADNAEVQDG